jgi:hypothetical protein
MTTDRRRKSLRFLFGPIPHYRANLDAEKPQRTACGFFCARTGGWFRLDETAPKESL